MPHLAHHNEQNEEEEASTERAQQQKSNSSAIKIQTDQKSQTKSIKPKIVTTRTFIHTFFDK